MKFQFEKYVNNKYYGLSQLGKLEQKTRDLSDDVLLLDFTQTDKFESHLSAILGAILTRVKENGNTIDFEFKNKNKVENILERNGFLSAFGHSNERQDIYGTTIKYKKFKVEEWKRFKGYLIEDLFENKNFPIIAKDLKSKISKSLIEVFKNPGFHTDCKYVFSCGQYYPQNKRLNFCITNLGKTIFDNVSHYLNEDISALKSIEWALEERNTTRQGNTPGGFGLPILKDFLKKHAGSLTIYSENGFWSDPSESIWWQETQPIKGTIVNLEFKIKTGSA